MNRKESEHSLIALLAKRYAAPEYSFLPHVRNGTGSQRVTRTADALAMSLWPSRGLDLMGFEVKVDRGDWLREIKDPAKAEEICRFCDRWWIVATDGIVQPGELPPTWGLIVAGASKLKTVKEAPYLEAQQLTRSMLGSILRVATAGMVPEASIKGRLAEAREEGKKSATQNEGWELKRAKRELEELRGKVAEFEKTSGVKLDGWDNRNVGEQFKRFQLQENVERSLDWILERAKEVVVKLESKEAAHA